MKPNLHKPDEKLLYNKVLDQVFLCLNDHKTRFTAFMNIQFASRFIEALSFEYDLTFLAYGGVEGTERVQIGLAPEYQEIENANFPIKAIEIKHNKFKNIAHKDILGSLLGLGIDRGKIGDIFIYEETSVVFVHEEIADFIYNNLTYIGSGKITTRLVEDLSFIFVPLQNYKELNITVDQERISEIIAKGFRLSRGDSVKLINSKKVFINWEQQTKDKNIEIGDTLTIRGYGRIVIQDRIQDRKTKANMLNIQVYGSK